MKVLFAVRPDLFRNSAGDTRQIVKTREALIRQGVHVDWSWDTDYSCLTAYDLVHFFNVTRVDGIYHLYQRAKKLQIKTVLTPLFWPLDAWREFLDKRRYSAWKAQDDQRRKMVTEADILLPSGYAEAEILESHYGKSKKWVPAYCGTDFHCPIQNWQPQLVICAARISPRKNQLILAQVCKDLSLRLILAGTINDTGYMKKILKANPDTIFSGHLSDKKLIKLYQNANIHVLPSWFETPGLSSLEAAACGCNIVSTNIGTCYEYFGDSAVYCQPGDADELHFAVTKALLQPRNPDLHKSIRSKFTWDRTADTIMSVYNERIGGSGL